MASPTDKSVEHIKGDGEESPVVTESSRVRHLDTYTSPEEYSQQLNQGYDNLLEDISDNTNDVITEIKGDWPDSNKSTDVPITESSYVPETSAESTNVPKEVMKSTDTADYRNSPRISDKRRVSFKMDSDDGDLNSEIHDIEGSNGIDHYFAATEEDIVYNNDKQPDLNIGYRRSSVATLGSGMKNEKVGSLFNLKGLQSLSEETDVDEWKPTYDHEPHQLFIELDELYLTEDNTYEWKEKARWIKYEENVEEGANKWGKPHVSSLSFHSLLDLRRCIEQGALLLDLEEDNLPAIAGCVTEQLIDTGLLPVQHRGKVMQLLTLKHRHLNQKGFLRRSSAFFQATDLRRGSLFHKSLPSQRMSLPQNNNSHLSTNGKRLSLAMIQNGSEGGLPLSPLYDQNGPPVSAPRKKSIISDHSILKSIPEGSETTSVLVGSLDYLDQPITAFVRLSQGCDLEDFTEVPLPARFLFLLLGPEDKNIDYREIGRSIATLMSNTSFHEVAYKAKDRKDLLNALNGFLDESMVLPPGDIDEKLLLPVIDVVNQRERDKRIKEHKVTIETSPVEPKFDPLKRTGKPFGGLINDVIRRYPQYWSDIKDGLNTQCLATFFFVYFACLAPAITFGGLLSEKTDGYLGVTEMLICTFTIGTAFALLSGQPLVIIGSTGPLLVFEEAVYQVCMSTGLDYLSMRCWIGFWVAIVTIFTIALEGVFLVRYITRFTQDIFATLTGLIFIIEVFLKVHQQFVKHPLQEYYMPIVSCLNNDGEEPLSTIGYITTDNSYTTATSNYVAANNSYGGANNSYGTVTNSYGAANSTYNSNDTTSSISVANGDVTTYEPAINMTSLSPYNPGLCVLNKPNTALLSVILTFGTFFIAYFFRMFKNSKFLGRTARRSLGDFGIPLAIVIMLVVDIVIGDNAYTEKLNVPDGLVPTSSDKRGWFVNPFGHDNSLPVWAMFAAIIPALLLFTLLFMETLISSMIVNKSENNLKKGTGYHLDMLIVGVFTSFSGITATPFLSIAIVRCVANVSALSVFSTSHAPGEKPKLVGIKEQRLTNILVHIMIGLSILLGPVLRYIPLAVLFGVFLYMGVASLSGIQMLDRVELMFMPVKHHPDEAYVKKVRLWKLNIFTLIQLSCLAVLWAVKSTQAALAFPFVLILTVPLRLHLLKYIYSKEELHALDKTDGQVEENKEEIESEPDGK